MPKRFESHRWHDELDFDGEVFAVHSIPGWLYTEWVTSRGTENDDVMAGLLMKMYELAMSEDDYERFRKFAQTDRGPEILVLIEAAEWMISEQTKRPTGPSSPSAAGRRRGKAGAGSSAPVRKLGASTSPTSAT